jgi:c-di-GMP-binding flagellar brake protein YcgR
MTSVLQFQPKTERGEPRKILRCPAMFMIQDHPAVRVRTIDISASGIAIMAPHNVPEGLTCGIAFTTFVNGHMAQINVMARVIYTICIGTEGFRVGMQFAEVDPASRVALTQLVG